MAHPEIRAGFSPDCETLPDSIAFVGKALQQPEHLYSLRRQRSNWVVRIDDRHGSLLQIGGRAVRQLSPFYRV